MDHIGELVCVCVCAHVLGVSVHIKMCCTPPLFTARHIDPLLDNGPVDVGKMLTGSLSRRFSALSGLASLTRTGMLLPL